MSSLPRSSGSFRRLRAVRSLVTQLFRRRRRKFVKKFAIPSITISSSPTPISANFTTMSLLLHCRHLARSNTGDDSAVSSPVSSMEDMFAEDVFRESGDEGPYDEDGLKLKAVSQRSVSHDSIFPKDFGRKMIRTSRGFTASTSEEHSSSSAPAGNVSSLMDISNALRTELENKMFVRAKRLNSGTNDQRFSARVRPDSTSSPFRTTSNFESSSNSMASFTTTSDVEVERNVTTSSRYSLLYDEKRGGAGDEGFQAMPTAQTSLLSHEAAKHRIAIKPKNRRPKSFHPTLETSPKSSPTRPEFSLPALPVSHHHHDANVSRHSVTVVSQVEATYEILPSQTFPEARQSQTSPQSTIREHTPRKASSTLAYSKSFHVARRTSSESAAASTPIAASISPRLARHQPLVAKSTPPQVLPKTFTTDNDEFKKVFSKFRKHTDADSFDTVISTNWEEPPSLVPKETPSSALFSAPGTNLQLTKSNSILPTKPVHRTVERKHSASSEHHRKSSTTISDMLADVSKQPAIPLQFQSHIPSFSSSKQTNPILPFKKMDYFPIKQESISSPVSSPSPFHSADIVMAHSDSSSSSSRSPPVVFDKPAIEYRKLPAISSAEDTHKALPVVSPKEEPKNMFSSDFSSIHNNDFSTVPISIPDRKLSFESATTTKPLVSPKPVVRVRSGLLSEAGQSKAEEELMKILAKRSAHLQELDGDQASPVFPLVLAVQSTPMSKPLSPVLKPVSPEVSVMRSPISFTKSTEVKEEPTFAKVEYARSSFDANAQRPLVPILKHLKTQNTIQDSKLGLDSSAESSLKNDMSELTANIAMLDALSTEQPFTFQRSQSSRTENNKIQKTSNEDSLTSSQSSQPKKKFFVSVEDNFTKPEPKKIDVYQSTQPFRSIFTDSSIKEKPLLDGDAVLPDLPVNSPVARRSSEPQPLKRFQPVEFPINRSNQPPSNENLPKKNPTWRRSMFEPSKNDSSADQENLVPHEPLFPVLTTTSKPTSSDEVIPYPKVSSRAAIFQQKSLTDFKPLSPRNGDNDRAKSGSVNRGSIRRPAASANELSQSTNKSVEPEVKTEVPFKPTLSQSQYPLTDSTWTASVPLVPLKPVVANKPTKMTPLSSQVSCGSLSSTVPSWVALAHEKRKRIEMLTESSAAY